MVGDGITYGEAWDLVLELKRETGSHLLASMQKSRWASSWTDEILFGLRHIYTAAHIDWKKHPELLEFPAPWNEFGMEEPEPEVTPEQRKRLRAYLQSVSAFRD